MKEENQYLVSICKNLYVTGSTINKSVLSILQRMKWEEISDVIDMYIEKGKSQEIYNMTHLVDKFDSYDKSSLIGMLVSKLMRALVFCSPPLVKDYKIKQGDNKFLSFVKILSHKELVFLIDYYSEEDPSFGERFSGILYQFLVESNGTTAIGNFLIFKNLIFLFFYFFFFFIFNFFFF